MSTTTIEDLRRAYEAAGITATKPDATAADHDAWYAAQQAYHKAGGREPVGPCVRYSGIKTGDWFIFAHGGKGVLVGAVLDNEGIACLYAGERDLVAEVYPDGHVEIADGWDARRPYQS